MKFLLNLGLCEEQFQLVVCPWNDTQHYWSDG